MGGLRAAKGTEPLCKRSRDSNPAQEAQPVAASLDLPAQGVDVCPQFPPRLALLLGQTGQGLLVAERRQVHVLLPVFEVLPDPLAFAPVFLDQGGVGGQVGPEPVEGLPAEAGPLPVWLVGIF